MAFARIRTFAFQNVSSGKIYDVKLSRQADGSVTGKGLLRGTNQINSDPAFDNTKVTFVVVTASLADVFGTAAKTESHLHQASIYHATTPGSAGAALSTLLV